MSATEHAEALAEVRVWIEAGKKASSQPDPVAVHLGSVLTRHAPTGEKWNGSYFCGGCHMTYAQHCKDQADAIKLWRALR
jgi:hypothetical protein